jgi:hypothetical protein
VSVGPGGDAHALLARWVREASRYGVASLASGRSLSDITDERSGRPPGSERVGRQRMLTARATTSVASAREIEDSAIIISFAHGLMAATSVGPNAVAVLNDRAR